MIARSKFTLWMIVALGISAIWILITAFYFPGQAEIQKPTAPKAGFRAPAFQLKTVDGDSVALADLAGNVVLLNFWASWCLPCRLEMPALEDVHRTYQTDGVIVLGVSSSSDNLRNAVQFMDEKQITFQVLRDEDNQVADLYGVRALPTTFLIDRNGSIAEVFLGGPLSEALLRSKILDLLNKEAEN